MNVTLAGEGAISPRRTLRRPDTQHLDNRTVIDHAQPHCESLELYKGILDEQRARRLRRPDHRPPRRPEDRLAPGEPQPAALRDRHRRFEADAGDPQRRREVQPRLDDRPDRRRAAVLPALPRHRRAGSAQPAGARIRQRDRRPDEDRARARAGSPRAVPGHAGAHAGTAGERHDERRLEANTACTYDVEKIRDDFPILSREVRGKPLVYLDNAATTQKPRAVIDRHGALLHRGELQRPSRRALPERAGHDRVRERARTSCSASSTPPDDKEIVFTRGTTEAINLVDADAGDGRTSAPATRSSISAIEHHSNIVPWQMLCAGKGRDAARHPGQRRRRAAARRVRAAAQSAR